MVRSFYIIRLKTRICTGSFLFLLICLLSTSCKRPVNPELEDGAEYELRNISITQGQKDTILNASVAEKTVQINKEYKITIPRTYSYGHEEISEDEVTFGKLVVSQEKNNTVAISLKNGLLAKPFAEEKVYFIKEKNASLLTVKDLLTEDSETEVPYFSDENSVILERAFSVFVYHFTYDTATASYIVYRAETSHFRDFTENDMRQMGFHLLRTAKRLTATANTDSAVFSWPAYVTLVPGAEIEKIKSTFKQFDKEMKAFLAPGEKTGDKSSEPDETYTLYHATNGQDLAFLDLVTAIKSRSDIEGNSSPENQIYKPRPGVPYNVTQRNNLYIIESSFKDDETIETSFDLLCRIEYDGKVFYIKSPTTDTREAGNMSAAVLSYFSKYKTLETRQKK